MVNLEDWLGMEMGDLAIYPEEDTTSTANENVIIVI